ncbi:hypothetical protein B0H10DRAFT_1953225 [Mycena sp. CBHHK59/15]|nr:hypothetical protein B0H10DRAFT_1953225 [Mycena sp. CBHHK59/15]
MSIDVDAAGPPEDCAPDTQTMEDHCGDEEFGIVCDDGKAQKLPVFANSSLTSKDLFKRLWRVLGPIELQFSLHLLQHPYQSCSCYVPSYGARFADRLRNVNIQAAWSISTQWSFQYGIKDSNPTDSSRQVLVA